MTTINIRIDEETKENSQKILKEMGMDLSTGIKLFLKAVNRTKSIPFEIRTENGFTEKFEREIKQEARESLKNSKSYNSVDEMFTDILK